MLGEDLRRRRRESRVSLHTGLRLVTAWHVAGALAAVLTMLLSSRSGDDELPSAIGILMRVFSVAAFVGHAYAAFAIRTVRRSGRTVSIVSSYLVFVVMAVAALHQFGAFVGIGTFGTGLYKGFVPFLVIVVGLLWVLVAGQMLSSRPTAVGPQRLRQAGWILAGLAFVWFVIEADPSGFVNAIGDTVVRPLTIGTVAVAVAAALSLRFMWQRRVAEHFGTTNAEQEVLSGLAFLSPNLIGFAFFFAGPLLFSLIVSFFDWKTTGTGSNFVFLDNYVEALSIDISNAPNANSGTEVLKSGYQVLMHADWFGQHWVIGARDVTFWKSLRNIIVFLVLAVPASVLPALGLSSILASNLRGMRIFRAIYFIPSVAGVIGVAIIWTQMFQSTVGWLNYIIDRAGTWLPFVDPPANGHPWLSSNSTALLAMVIVFAWMNFGFITVLYLAGHQAIPKELYEAAEIDGARTWRIFRRITVPQLRNTTFYVLVTTSILALQLFDIVWILSTPQPGGPDNATMTPVIALYDQAFKQNRTGYSAALAWVLFLVIFGFTFAQFRRDREGATSGGMA